MISLKFWNDKRALVIVEEINWKNYISVSSHLTLGRTEIHTPTVVHGGWMETLPGVFDMLQYFETILP